MRTRVQNLIATLVFAVLIGTAAHAGNPVVDPRLVGTWELQVKGGPWILEIHSDGTYSFHSEAGDRVPPHSGTFSAGNGRWLLKATTGYTDMGVYVFQPPDTLIATGLRGTAAWRQRNPTPADAPKPADAAKPASNTLGMPQDF